MEMLHIGGVDGGEVVGREIVGGEMQGFVAVEAFTAKAAVLCFEPLPCPVGYRQIGAIVTSAVNSLYIGLSMGRHRSGGD